MQVLCTLEDDVLCKATDGFVLWVSGEMRLKYEEEEHLLLKLFLRILLCLTDGTDELLPAAASSSNFYHYDALKYFLHWKTLSIKLYTMPYNSTFEQSMLNLLLFMAFSSFPIQIRNARSLPPTRNLANSSSVNSHIDIPFTLCWKERCTAAQVEQTKMANGNTTYSGPRWLHSKQNLLPYRRAIYRSYYFFFYALRLLKFIVVYS